MLLAVFLPMFVVSSLHVHPVAHSATDECEECVHHLPHAGHIGSVAIGCFSDCVLCQFLSLPFLTASAVVLSVVLPTYLFPFHFGDQHVLCGVKGIVSLRAPPVLDIREQ